MNGCGAVMNIIFRRKGSVVRRRPSSNATRPLLWEHGWGLACAWVIRGERHSKDIAAVILPRVRRKLGETRVFLSRVTLAQLLTCGWVRSLIVLSTL